jgi:hypothetical protein
MTTSWRSSNSVFHQYGGEKLELHSGDALVKAYCRQQLVATHPRKRHPVTTTERTHFDGI